MIDSDIADRPVGQHSGAGGIAIFATADPDGGSAIGGSAEITAASGFYRSVAAGRQRQVLASLVGGENRGAEFDAGAYFHE